MKDSAKSNLQTPKKEGFTRYDKTILSCTKVTTPISEKKIHAVSGHENQAIFKSPSINPPLVITGQTLNNSPTYQGYGDTPFMPLNFHCEYPPMDNFCSPFKRDFKNPMLPLTHHQNGFPYKFPLYNHSNASSPFQEKANNNGNNQPEYAPNRYYQQNEEPNQVEENNEMVSNIESDLIFSEQNGASLLACESLHKQLQSDQTQQIQGSIILKKPKFVIEFKNDEELQEFKNSDEFKQLVSKINFSENYFKYEIPKNQESSQIAGKSLFNSSRVSKKSAASSSSRTPTMINQFNNRYISPNPYPPRGQFMMHPRQYQYGMSPYYNYSEMVPINSANQISNSPNQKNNIYKNGSYENRGQMKANTQLPPFAYSNNANRSALSYYEKQVGKILFDNTHERNGEYEQNEQHDSKEESRDEETPRENSQEDYIERNKQNILQDNNKSAKLQESRMDDDDNNTISVPLNEEQKKILKEQHQKIHNQPHSTFLEQQIQSIQQNSMTSTQKKKKIAIKSEQGETVENTKAEPEVADDIEEVMVKRQVISANKQIKNEEGEHLEEENEQRSQVLNNASQSTAKKMKSATKNEHQDSINKKRRHFDTPSAKRNEFSTPSTKKKYDQQLSKSKQGYLPLNSKSSTTKVQDSRSVSTKNQSKSAQQSQQKGKTNQLVSDFSNEIANNHRNQSNKEDEESNSGHSHECNEHNHHHNHHHDHHERSELEDRDLMAEEEDLRAEDEELDEDEEDLLGLSDSDKKECCGCKKTKCLKLYCECFQAMKYCVGNNCQGCLNKPQFEDLRKQAMDSIQQRNSSAFDPKVDKNDYLYKSASASKTTHSKGCNCKKSDCRKKYCECFQMGAKCTHLCKCFNCKNRHDSGHEFYSGSKQGMAIHPLYMDVVPSHMHPPPHPHLLGVPPQYPYRAQNQGPMLYQYPQMYHPHSSAQGYYDSWNHYYNHEYNYSRQGDQPGNGQSNQQPQPPAQPLEYDNTPKFNSMKRQQSSQHQQKLGVQVKDFTASASEKE